jgi:hypothetical protein
MMTSACNTGIGGSEIDQVIKVEPPKPTPRWVLKLRGLVRRREHTEAPPQ